MLNHSKITTFFLLATYGLLSVVGPHWHQHDCSSCSFWSSNGDSSLAENCHSLHEAANYSYCCSDEPFHESVGDFENSSSLEGIPSPNGGVLCRDIAGSAEDCLICHFYATSAFQSNSASIEFQQLASPSNLYPSLDIHSGTAWNWLARGPPPVL